MVLSSLVRVVRGGPVQSSEVLGARLSVHSRIALPDCAVAAVYQDFNRTESSSSLPDSARRRGSSPRRRYAQGQVGLDLLLGLMDRLGSDPLTVQKQIRVSDSTNDVYAGSAFVSSPHPSSVPVPGFLGRNAATSDLRRLMRLNLD
ncbi:hypothetical protein Fmac_021239 [Flemingia macrophylla]|uniref:Uncharacterized protein n=1 Tax=Flemingia macrophylla TaxID=520843 RepID=A0ABD1LWI4_9FABA